MNAPAQTKASISLSGDLETCEGAPEPDGELSLLVEDYFEVTARANIAITQDGTNRKVIKPTVTTIEPGASCEELIDLLHEIAWSHCSKAGTKTRYCAQLFTQEEGKTRLVVKRAYFTLSPDGAETVGDVPRTDAEYIQSLQRFSITCLDRQSRSYHRGQLREQETRQLAYDSLVEMRHAITMQKDTNVEQTIAQGQEQRKTALFESISGLLPAIARRHLFEEKPANGEKKDPPLKLSEQKPMDRLRDYLTGAELAALEAAVPSNVWAELVASDTMADAKKLITQSSEETAVAIFAAVPEGKLAEIAGWG